MSNQPQKGKNRWGSMFSGAIAGLESRLDTILAEDDQASARLRASERAKKLEAAQKLEAQKQALLDERERLAEKGEGTDGGSEASEEPMGLPPLGQAPSTSRKVSHNRTRTSDRLAERLARAVSGNAGSDSPAPSTVESEPRTSNDSKQAEPSSPAPGQIPLAETAETIEDEPAPEMEEETREINESNEEPKAEVDETKPEEDEKEKEPQEAPMPTSDEKVEPTPDAAIGPEQPPAEPAQLRTSAESDRPHGTQTPASESAAGAPSQQIQDPQLAALKAEHANEIHTYMERIDALQSKLAYLSSQATESARASKGSASSSLEKKLADRDERIAALMEEGQKLSKTELTQLATIRKMRARILDDEKTSKELKKRIGLAEKIAMEAVERVRTGEAAEKQHTERSKALAKAEREVEVLKQEQKARNTREQDLRRQIREAERRADEAALMVQAMEKERALVKELREELEDMKIARKLAEDRAKAETVSAREETNREREKAKQAELEMKNEISSLESKLEILRSHTEEASAFGSSDDNSQAKLLRQIETLQTQYGVASENWQGIESALTSRVASLERERDDLARRESEVRRKARELTSKTRNLESELETVREREATLSSNAEMHSSELSKLQAKLEQAESDAADAVAEHKKDRKVWEAETTQKLEEERMKRRLEQTTTSHTSASQAGGPLDSGGFLRADSPSMAGASLRRLSGIQAQQQSEQQTLGGRTTLADRRRSLSRHASSDLALPLPGKNHSRRGSALRSPGDPTSGMIPRRQDSFPSMGGPNGTGTSTPALHPLDAEEIEAGSSPVRSPGPDMLSMNTVSAGPSVQLVERMSAAVRRLESEKAANKEEMVRVVGQRDEAREEVVSLMKEVEAAKAVEERAKQAEKEVTKMDERYQTTLEMLGEKSEMVDELRNDVEDLKKIIREMVENQVKK